ncbi:MAG: MaoC family dehydratase [Pseudomonadota bacterium]
MSGYITFEELNIGEDLTPVIKKMTQEKINRYVSIAEDYNPIHTDEEFAKKTPFKGIIAPGYQTMAYISELMSRDFGNAWYTSGKMDIRMVKVVRPGDLLTARAKVVDKKEEEGKNIAVFEVRLTNQNNEDVIIGNAEAAFPKNN